MAGRVTANLNYTASPDVLNACIRQAGIRHVLTSRKVMENRLRRNSKKLDAEFVYLEDLRDKVTRGDKLAGALGAYRRPGISARSHPRPAPHPRRRRADGDLHLRLHRHAQGRDAHAPQHRHQRRGDRPGRASADRRTTILGIVPFFHSLGFTVTLWGPLLLDIRAAYHFSPLETRIVAKLARSTRRDDPARHADVSCAATCGAASRKSSKSLEIVVAGAEKLPIAAVRGVRAEVRRAAGRRLRHDRALAAGVGQRAAAAARKSLEVDCKEGSVGRPVPGVSVKIVDPETFEPLPLGTPGMLLVKGPNVMKGYLGQPEETAKVIRDGWYVTGDIAMIDTDGFIHITGR